MLVSLWLQSGRASPVQGPPTFEREGHSPEVAGPVHIPKVRREIISTNKGRDDCVELQSKKSKTWEHFLTISHVPTTGVQKIGIDSQ